MGDGCLMEGISHEAASLAGTLKLGKLIAIWDDNGISIDGEVHGWFTDDTPARFEAYGWEVLRDVDGHNPEAIKAALVSAALDPDKPTLICAKTIIGYGAPNKQGKESCHGAALGKDEVAAARATLGWNHPPFVVPDDIYDAWNAEAKGAERESQWNALFAALSQRASRSRRRVRAPHERRAARRFRRARRCVRDQAAGRGPGRRIAQGLADGARCVRPETARADRRLGRSCRLEPDDLEGLEGRQRERRERKLRLLRRARVRHERDLERPGAARRLRAVRRDVPGVLRLRAQRRAHVGADPGARDPRLHARFDWPGRGRSDASAGRASGEPALHPEQPRLAPVRRGRIGYRVESGDRARERAIVPGFLAAESRAPAPHAMHKSARSRAAATCSPSPAARSSTRS